MFKHNLISNASTGFYLYFKIATEPIMSGTYPEVCCLFSEFTASHKWDFLLDTGDFLLDIATYFCSY